MDVNLKTVIGAYLITTLLGSVVAGYKSKPQDSESDILVVTVLWPIIVLLVPFIGGLRFGDYLKRFK